MFVDCTVGLGGHARALLETGAARLIGLETSDIVVNEIDIIGTAARLRIDTLGHITTGRAKEHPIYNDFRYYAEAPAGTIDLNAALPNAYRNLCGWLDAESPLATSMQSLLAVQRSMDAILDLTA